MFIVFPRFRIRISVFALPIMLLMLWCEGAFPFFVLFMSALMHEIGHLTAMNLLGYKHRRIDILPMGALIVCPEGIPYEKEGLIAIWGPVASLLLALAFGILFAITSKIIMLFGLLMNFTLGIFNLMPIRKLDGGKALYCFLSAKEKSTEPICSVLSYGFAFMFLCFVGVFIYVTGYNLGVIILSVVLVIQLLEK